MKIALPISFAILIPQLNFITNNVFLGHYSKQALAIAGITGVFYLIFASIGFGLNNGLQALISRRAGENRPEEIGKLFNQGVFIAMTIAALGIILTYLFVPAIFGLFVKDPVRLEQAVSFLKIRIWGLPFLYIYQMRNALLVGTNQSKYLIAGTVAETVANVFLDYVLIFGALGFPKLGFNGAAYASIVAEFTGMIVVFLVIYRKGISQRFQLFKHFRWDPKNLKGILNMSAPLIFQHAISIMSWEYFFLLIDGHGEMALAVSNTMRNVFGLFGAVTWAFAATTSTMVSNIIGQKKPEQVWTLIKRLIRINLSFAIIVAVLLNLFPHLFLSIYGQPAAFTEAALPVIRIVSIAMILMSVSVIFINAVIGTGNSRVTLIIEACTIVVYCIYVTIVLKELFLPIAIGWMSEWLYWMCLLIPSFFYMRSGRWKNKVI
ncbi:MAG: MATE family efflux transporter [Chitinophagaceae bacterium]|nr:MATE family efflux transporter [Chitinophagaceae bacterium]